MAMILNPYVSFRDNAREAMDFYQSVLGGELTVTTFGDFGGDPADADKVMHSQLDTPGGLTLMGADTPAGMEYNDGDGRITISLSGEDQAELRGLWDGLTAGGTVVEPFEVAPWGDYFGMCIDRFGVPWMFNSGSPEDAEA